MKKFKKATQAAQGLLAHEEAKSHQVCVAARMMAQLSHPQRLRVLCHLVEEGELSVGDLLERIPLSASALSQHLAKMREDELLVADRRAKNVYYRIEREDVRQILALLHDLYCGRS